MEQRKSLITKKYKKVQCVFLAIAILGLIAAIVGAFVLVKSVLNNFNSFENNNLFIIGIFVLLLGLGVVTISISEIFKRRYFYNAQTHAASPLKNSKEVKALKNSSEQLSAGALSLFEEKEQNKKLDVKTKISKIEMLKKSQVITESEFEKLRGEILKNN